MHVFVQNFMLSPPDVVVYHHVSAVVCYINFFSVLKNANLQPQTMPASLTGTT